MGKLVTFERRKASRQDDRPAGTTDAEILIFTGIRYERQAPASPTKPSTSPGAKRKRG